VVATASDVDASTAAQARCGAELRAVGSDHCTHGGDHVPRTVARRAVGVPTPAGSSANDLCAGDGVSGRRVRVNYGYPSDTPENVSTYRSWIRQSVATADASLDARTPHLDGQHFRMYCWDDRAVSVKPIALLPIGGDNFYTFDDVIDSLESRVGNGLGEENIDTPRFTYVVFVDNIACCYGPAGQGTIYWDDRPDPDQNFNNRVASGPRFAMVEINVGSQFAGAFVFLHEVGHTIGAVPLSAPHSTLAGHCYTAVDVMCYQDGGPWFTSGGTMTSVCAAKPEGQFTFDCQGGDYYEVDPAPGGFLASHWNTADSGWLTNPA
jgi:hypothetical protein